MKQLLLFVALAVLSLGCNKNPNKEERIQTLEAALKTSQKKISELEKKVESTVKNKTFPNENNMKLGAFSISLNVKDIEVSKKFYENLGFTKLGGDLKKNYLILKNENAIIGIFQNMFEGNILTFNPGWDENAKEIESFTDIRKIQQELKAKGINIGEEIKEASSGPASFTLTDPDGNLIYIDQHR